VLPTDTSRLRFREMTEADVNLMAGLLGDPQVMRFYPRPKTRDEAMGWIEWNQANYATHGYGLWIIETHDGDFVGDCGLTWQEVGDNKLLEVGYHVGRILQGKGFATEAARACLDLAAGPIGEAHVVAIINPENVPSRRVAEKLDMRVEQETNVSGRPAVVYGRDDSGSREAGISPTLR
jgi:RimJ/RimL family protein N-acetyltransferase